MFNVKVRNKENPGEKETHNAKQWCTRLSQKKKGTTVVTKFKTNSRRKVNESMCKFTAYV